MASWSPANPLVMRLAGWQLVIAGGALVMAGLIVPVRSQFNGIVYDRDIWPAVAELREQLEGLDVEGDVLVEMAGLPFPEYFSHVVLAELSEQGIDFTVSTPTMVAQLGPGRRDDRCRATRIFLLIGPDAGVAPPGARRLAFVSDAETFSDGRRHTPSREPP